MTEGRADAVVLFGATGDLVRKKLLPALYQLARVDRLGVPVIGVARSAWEDERLRSAARSAVEAIGKGPVDEEAFRQLAEGMTMLVGDYGDEAMYDDLARRLEGSERPVFYLAIPPSVFPEVVRGLAKSGLAARGRVIVEKPFGRDQASARELNGWLAGAFEQDSIFRIDHYLGKESVEGLLVFRFANTFLEPFWNRNYVAGVQITLGEAFGTEGRAGFYDGVGAVRDVLQNHLLQVVALLAMEPPIADDADAYRDEEVKVLRQISPLQPRNTVRGQYVGYLDEEGVAPSSTTETFVSTCLTIESWRWAGVPFYLRAGKYMPGSATEAVIELRRPPRLLFAGHEADVPSTNLVRFRLGHSDGVTLSVQAKAPGARTLTQPVDLTVDFESALGHRREAYERLLDDAMDGRRHRFAREDTIEEEWRIVDPILDLTDRPVPYYKGTWGPPSPTSPADGWHDVALRT
ncbi:MAG TPA: glucose-6-phosphate dehydrogenase [Mycobacteriales bacterium]|jgi:glucose-6-phosphate 1-dehydrogenase|nr:glucose-6-phosphate dehydrogenase [Mycobacteriales bacterium]